MEALITAAKDFARHAHYGQLRKYTGEPYWTHTEAVADMVRAHGGTWQMTAAAHLHDTLEDTGAMEADLRYEFGDEVTDLVIELTDVYTPLAYPDMNRFMRKLNEAMRLSGISNNAKTIKVADLIDNTASIVEYDPKFAVTYLKEKELVLVGMRGAYPDLLERAKHQIIIP